MSLSLEQVCGFGIACPASAQHAWHMYAVDHLHDWGRGIGTTTDRITNSHCRVSTLPPASVTSLQVLTAMLYCIHHPISQGWLLLCVWRLLCALLQAERLEELQERLSVPYDSDNRQHQQQLQELWVLAFPELPFSTLKSNQWKEMGWQVGGMRQEVVLLDVPTTTCSSCVQQLRGAMQQFCDSSVVIIRSELGLSF